MTVRNPYHEMPRVPDWQRAKDVFAKQGGDKYIRTVSLHRSGNKDYQLRWMPEIDTYLLLRNGQCVIRYDPPNSLGAYTVRIMNPNFKGMNQFFAHRGWQSWVPRLVTTSGKRVVAPLVPHWETFLVFDCNHHLVVEDSYHGDLYTMYSSDELKEQVAELHQRIEPLVNLCLLRVDEYLTNADVIYRYANRNFVSIDTSMWVGNYGRAEDVIRNFLFVRDAAIDEATIQSFFAVTEEVVKFRLSKAWAKIGSTSTGSRFETAKAALSHDNIRSSLQYVCTKLAGLHRANAKRALPKFPAKLPRRVVL